MLFECDLCVFRKLRKVSPDVSLHADRLLLACIRRINVDDFWSRATSTVESNCHRVADSIRLTATVSLVGPCASEGPFPASDNFGYEVAIIIVFSLRLSGRHNSEHTQWETIRKFRSTYSNYVRTTPKSVGENLQLSQE